MTRVEPLSTPSARCFRPRTSGSSAGPQLSPQPRTDPLSDASRPESDGRSTFELQLRLRGFELAASRLQSLRPRPESHCPALACCTAAREARFCPQGKPQSPRAGPLCTARKVLMLRRAPATEMNTSREHGSANPLSSPHAPLERRHRSAVLAARRCWRTRRTRSAHHCDAPTGFETIRQRAWPSARDDSDPSTQRSWVRSVDGRRSRTGARATALRGCGTAADNLGGGRSYSTKGNKSRERAAGRETLQDEVAAGRADPADSDSDARASSFWRCCAIDWSAGRHSRLSRRTG